MLRNYDVADEIFVYVWMEVDSAPGGLMVRQVTKPEFEKAARSRHTPSRRMDDLNLSGHCTHVLYPESWTPALIVSLQPLLEIWLGKRKMLSIWRKYAR